MGEQPLNGLVALVINGSHGIGAVISDALTEQGAGVAIGYAREDRAIREFLDTRTERQISGHQGRLDSATDCDRVISEVINKHGTIDILVTLTNFTMSGILDVHKDLANMAPGEWDRVINTHLSGAFYMARAAVPHMVESGFGRIIHVLGPAGAHEAGGHYAVTRSAVGTFNARLAKEVASQAVTVNTVACGLLHDEMHALVPGRVLTDAVGRVPAQRLGHPDEVARAVGFFANPHSGYMTGQILGVDGGLSHASDL